MGGGGWGSVIKYLYIMYLYWIGLNRFVCGLETLFSFVHCACVCEETVKIHTIYKLFTSAMRCNYTAGLIELIAKRQLGHIHMHGIQIFGKIK